MDKVIISKNVLDLAYKRNLQIANTILFIGGGSVVASLTGLILNFDEAFRYSIILFIAFLFSYIFYNIINEKLKSISKQIRSLT